MLKTYLHFLRASRSFAKTGLCSEVFALVWALSGGALALLGVLGARLAAKMAQHGAKMAQDGPSCGQDAPT